MLYLYIMPFEEINTKDGKKIKDYFQQLILPKENSHKGENGRMLIIGGSSLFHTASIWAAEVASYFVDIVHYSSTKENNQIFLSMKKKFKNGIITPQNDLLSYAQEDNVVLIGPGMIRGNTPQNSINDFEKILSIKNEAYFTYHLIHYLLKTFTKKKFVIDAGALQMMKKDWLKGNNNQIIITPHQKEFSRLFNIQLVNKTIEEKTKIVKETAEEYQITILLKAIVDIVSDGKKTLIIKGGNQGLTKGGTGDVLAGLTSAFFCRNVSFNAAIFASILLKKTADRLFQSYGYWYNINRIIDEIPKTINSFINQ